MEDLVVVVLPPKAQTQGARRMDSQAVLGIYLLFHLYQRIMRGAVAGAGAPAAQDLFLVAVVLGAGATGAKAPPRGPNSAAPAKH
jgi:hypothetical protein